MSKNSEKYVCVHGHFYQPPRENPWLNTVEIQDSAYPYHDWNHRINAECYARNSASRILNSEGKVIDIINNYAWMSFNIGPTLLAWMETEAPDIYAAILEADRQSMENFGGHGSALAQVYNHMIMPLANRRDKETQVIWGIEDFKYRYGRFPEGMWLGETAVNTETLEVLAEYDIKFTILSPYQAKKFRKIGDHDWKDGTHAKINPRNSYICHLPSGKNISLFFYDGAASQAVAFEGLLNDGDTFANRLRGQFTNENKPQLVHIATDGESYGHHHKKGEMALSYCLNSLRQNQSEYLTIYGEYLEKFPPQYEVEIAENSSWSCYHGVERWKSDCGCNTGGNKDWNQKWRAPLRNAFDWARKQFTDLFEQEIQEYSKDPWDIRNEYISVILDRSGDNVSGFIDRNFDNDLNKEERIKILKLLEMQYHCMLMYTSCGWFFDEVTGIETMQDILYAARAIQLAQDISGKNYEDEFLELLSQAPSNLREFRSAADAYVKYVKPMKVDMLRVGAHFAVSSLFREFPEETMLYSFMATSKWREYYEAGKQKLVVGRAHLQSNVTWEEIDISYAMLHLGEHHLFGGVRPYSGKEGLENLHKGISEAFKKSRSYDIFNLMDRHFGNHNYSFWHLFRDEQKSIMEQVMENTLKNAEGTIYQLYENNFPIVQVFKEINMSVPKQLKLPVDLAINTRLANILGEEDIKLKELKKILDSVERISVDIDFVTLNFIANEKINILLSKLEEDPGDHSLLQYIVNFLQLIKKGGLQPEFWEAQNMAFRINRDHYENYCAKYESGDREAESWCILFDELYKNLNLVI